MNRHEETAVSKTILESHHKELLSTMERSVVIIGAGPAGMTAALRLAVAWQQRHGDGEASCAGPQRVEWAATRILEVE